MSKRILLDYDMSLANTFIEQIELLNNEFGKIYKHEDFYTWATEDVCEPEEVSWLWGPNCFLNEDFQRNVAPVEGAIESVLSLLDQGHHCMVVSDRPSELFEVTRDWLDRQGLDMVRLLFTRHKHSVNSVSTDGTMTKAQAAWSYKLDTVVDDALHHCRVFAEKPWINQVYMLNSPHNQNYEHPKVMRCFGWPDVTRAFAREQVYA
jgi:uncharacterized HAD superfamily protein